MKSFAASLGILTALFAASVVAGCGDDESHGHVDGDAGEGGAGSGGRAAGGAAAGGRATGGAAAGGASTGGAGNGGTGAGGDSAGGADAGTGGADAGAGGAGAGGSGAGGAGAGGSGAGGAGAGGAATGGADAGAGGAVSTDYRTPTQTAPQQVSVAGGLTATYLTREIADAADMMAFFPVVSPTHLIVCIEGDTEDLPNGKKNPSVQRVNLSTGAVETILRGMTACDGIRATPWGTILATEEAGDGGAYEILNPLTTTEITITNRGSAGVAALIADAQGADASNLVRKRIMLPTMAWEGFEILPSGVVIGGDELRPGTVARDTNNDGTDDNSDSDGGALFKFIPATLRTGTADITDLASSPFVDGTTYAMQVSCQGGTQQVGQGCEVGSAAWIQVDQDNARVDADQKGATGYYRPEDLHLDPVFTGTGVRFCWTDTGNEGASNWSEVMCAVDSSPTTASATVRSVVVSRFWGGDPDFNSADNLAFQPGTGILYVIEDHDNGDVFACLPDGADRDLQTDGCVRMLGVFDESAEPTGFIFSADGMTAYVNVQHSADGNMTAVDGYGTDDLVRITGFGAVNASLVASFGTDRQTALGAASMANFGVGTPLGASAPASAADYRATTKVAGKEPSGGIASFGDDATAQVLVAGGLTPTYVTRYAASDADMMAFWPHGSSTPTHVVSCVEGGNEVLPNTKMNPAVQIISLTDGSVRTILRGMSRCDGIRTTPWGTVLATEEEADGSVYEILDPTDTAEYTITDRAGPGVAATIVDSSLADATSHVVKRTELPTMAWEGFIVTDSGVVIGGDELRPGSYDDPGTPPHNVLLADTDGGAIFKFVPTTLRTGSANITALDQSPLVAGTTYAMQVSCQGGAQQVGQGCETGAAAWVAVDPDDARVAANAAGATGYYRPEDLHADPTFTGTGVRFCWANTGNQSSNFFSEVMCAVDSSIDTASATARTVVVTRFIEGGGDFGSADNLDFQPGTGILYVIEDDDNGDVWACLPDGPDRDVKSDGCVKVLSVKDSTAEPTGFIFHPDGTRAYLFIQHSDDSGDADLVFDGYATDDMILVSGFATPSAATTFGMLTQAELSANASSLFGFTTPLASPVTQP